MARFYRGIAKLSHSDSHDYSGDINETTARPALKGPADQCPYPKPFLEGFDECPAFQQAHFIPLDSSFRPLAPALTCRHLQTSEIPGNDARWYGACEIGDAAARRRWVTEVDSERLRAIASIRRRMEVINRPFIERIWAAKARQLAAAERGQSDKEAVAEMEQLAKTFEAESAAFMRAHGSELLAVGLAPDAVLELLRRSLDYFMRKRSTEARWEVTDDLLSEFPEPVRTFFRPRRTSP